MWLGIAATRSLLLVLSTVFLREVYTSDVEQTATLTNISSTVINSPISNAHLYSTIGPKEIKDVAVNSTVLSHATETSPGVSAITEEIAGSIRPILSIVNNESMVHRTESNKSEMIMAPTISVLQSTTEYDHPEFSSTPISEMEKNENFTTIMTAQKPSVSMVLDSSQPQQKTVILNASETKLAATGFYESKILNPIVSTLHSQQSVVLTLNHSTPSDKSSKMLALPKQSFSISAAMSSVGLRQITNNSASIVPLKSESVTENIGAKENISGIFSQVNESFTRSEQSAVNLRISSVKLNPRIKFITTISSSEEKETNKTPVLIPSPSMKQHVIFTSPDPVANVTHITYNKIFVRRISPTENDTNVKHTKSEGALFTTVLNENTSTQVEVHNVNLTKTEPTISALKHGNITVSNSMFKLVDKTLITTQKWDIHVSSSELQVYSKILPKTSNRTMPASNIHMSAQFSKLSSNQTQTTDSFTTYRLIQPSSSPSSVYKAIANRTEKKNLITDSMTMLKSSRLTYTKNTSVSMNLQKSSTELEIKPTRTAFFGSSKNKYSTRIPNTPILATKRKEQRFSVKLKITSEEFRDEYVTGEGFKQKSKEIEQQFDAVFKHMVEYLFTKVLRFFSGSLGCDVVIYTVSADLEGVSAQEIYNTIEKASNTTGGLGKFVVGDIEVKEQEDGEKEDDDKKETWGRLPVIVISILGGVCLVLLVLVISQCIQKRHYSHSLAESNEIQEFSPAVQLKNNDDSMYKDADEERVPMTTFNQTDIY